MGRHKKTDREPGILISREAYNSFLRRLAVSLGCQPEAADAAVRAEYPKSSCDATYELRSRGINASEYALLKFSRTNPVRVCGGSSGMEPAGHRRRGAVSRWRVSVHERIAGRVQAGQDGTKLHGLRLRHRVCRNAADHGACNARRHRWNRRHYNLTAKLA